MKTLVFEKTFVDGHILNGLSVCESITVDLVGRNISAADYISQWNAHMDRNGYFVTLISVK